jgi:hypothetical protein
MSRLRSGLYRWARLLGDLEALFSGRPGRIARRAKNKIAGRLLGRAGVWRKLWGGRR